MGQKLKIWATMTSIILLSGMLGFGFSPDALATHNDNGKGLAEGCVKKNDNGNKENNPHCTAQEPLPPSVCDNDPEDGMITAAELAAHTGDSEAVALAKILTVEGLGGSNTNGVIDTQKELDDLNTVFSAGC